MEEKKFKHNLFKTMQEQEEFCDRWRKVCKIYQDALAEYKATPKERLQKGERSSHGRTFR